MMDERDKCPENKKQYQTKNPTLENWKTFIELFNCSNRQKIELFVACWWYWTRKTLWLKCHSRCFTSFKIVWDSVGKKSEDRGKGRQLKLLSGNFSWKFSKTLCAFREPYNLCVGDVLSAYTFSTNQLNMCRHSSSLDVDNFYILKLETYGWEQPQGPLINTDQLINKAFDIVDHSTKVITKKSMNLTLDI